MNIQCQPHIYLEHSALHEGCQYHASHLYLLENFLVIILGQIELKKNPGFAEDFML